MPSYSCERVLVAWWQRYIQCIDHNPSAPRASMQAARQTSDRIKIPHTQKATIQKHTRPDPACPGAKASGATGSRPQCWTRKAEP